MFLYKTKQIKYYSIFIIKVPFQTDRIQNVTMEQITKWRGTTSIGYNGHKFKLVRDYSNLFAAYVLCLNIEDFVNFLE